MEQEDAYLYELKQCGLTEDEIDFKLKCDKNLTQTKVKVINLIVYEHISK